MRRAREVISVLLLSIGIVSVVSLFGIAFQMKVDAVTSVNQTNVAKEVNVNTSINQTNVTNEANATINLNKANNVNKKDTEPSEEANSTEGQEIPYEMTAEELKEYTKDKEDTPKESGVQEIQEQ